MGATRGREGFKRVIAKEIVLSLIVFLLSLGYLLQFYDRGVDFKDEGATLYIADRVAQGDLLYKDMWWQWTPGVYYLLALSFKLLGTSIWTGRVVTALFGALTSVVIYRLASLLVSRPLSLFPSALFVVWGLPFHFQPYHSWFALFFSLCSVLMACYYIESKNVKLLLISGALNGITAFFKINYGGLTYLSIVAYLFLVKLLARGGKAKTRFMVPRKEVALLSAGALIFLVPASLYFYIKGNFGEMVQAIFFNLGIRQIITHSYPNLFDSLGEFSWAKPYNLMMDLPFPIYLGALLLFSRGDVVRKRRLLLLYLYAFFFFFTAYPQFDWHHIIQVLVPIYLLLALLMDEALWKVRTLSIDESQLHAAILFFLVLSSAILLVGGIKNRADFFRDSNYTINFDDPRGGIYISQAETGNEHITEIVDFMKKAEGEVFVIPHHPLFYFLAEQKSPSRFLESTYATTKEVEREQVEDLEKGNVSYILLFYGAARTDWGTGKSYLDLTDLRVYVYTHYAIVDYYSTFVKETELDAMNILVLKRIEAGPQNYVKLSLPAPGGKDFYFTTKEVIERVISAGLTEERALRPDDKQH